MGLARELSLLLLKSALASQLLVLQLSPIHFAQTLLLHLHQILNSQALQQLGLLESFTPLNLFNQHS